MKSIQTFLAIAALALTATQLSCTVNQYCIGCGVDDAGSGSGSNDGGDDDANTGSDDAMVDAGCVPTGPEMCDGHDNDCDGLVDNGTLPNVGDTCQNVMGACSGGVLECSQGVLRCDKLPTPEICDLIDNNCNGAVDESDPGGGGLCGTNQGECVAGTRHCNPVVGCDPSASCDPIAPAANCCVTCTGFQDHRTDTETCDGEDDDCDGKFDENVGSLGTCGPTTDEGVCNIGTLICQGGTGVCSNAVFPKFELCNNLDDDCDMGVDEIFDLKTDARNCGTCGTVCPTASKTCINATNPNTNGMNCTMASDCPGGTCAINSQARCAPNMAMMGTCGYVCNAGFIDRDMAAANGCEYRCFPNGAEVCDGVDNDCDGNVDNGLTAPAICLAGGECGMVAPTATCMGAQGWKCTYPGTVQFPETRCDGLNNDCDANTDENQPNLTQACDDGKIGICKGTGTFQCDTTSEMTRNGPAKCQVTMAGNPNPNGDGFETCDDKDNDCDGKTDEGSETGMLAGQTWVNLGNGREIMKFEASRQDSTMTQQGTKSGIIAAPLVATPMGATESGSTATFTTTQPHGLSVGAKVRVSGVGVGGYNGLWTIVSVPTTTTFTATLPTTGLAASGDGSVVKYIGACSKAGSIPWTNVTYPEALAVCESMNASLCSETRWHEACSVVPPKVVPIAIDSGTTATSGTFIEAEDFYKNVFAGGPETTCTGATFPADDNDGDGRVNDGCPAFVSGGGPETAGQCTNNTDDDADGRVNDGCPVQEEGAETGNQCLNNSDDDGDGRDNDGCPAVDGLGAETGNQCNNNSDDDGDGRDNDGCPAVTLGAGAEVNCTNTSDDDGDGRVNDGCPAFTLGAGAETICTGTSNNDDDGDGRANDGCPQNGAVAETGNQCNNNNDDDNDGFDNDGCPAIEIGTGPETVAQCANNNDDDNDGRINDGCAATDKGAGPETGTQCNNNNDDDADGRDNDGCPAVTQGVGPETGAQCNNNSDDDNDGRDNDGCPTVVQGTGPETACADATDDDGDGFVNDGCPEFIGGAETGAQCDNNTDDDGDGLANDGCPSVGPQAWEEDYTPANTNLTYPQAHLGIGDMRALPNLGSTFSLTSALAGSPYLEYRVNLPQAATNWRLWVRMYAPTNNDDVVHYSVSTSTTAVAPTASLTASSTGSWVWMQTPDLNLAAGDQYIRLFMGEDGLKVDALFIGRTGTPAPPCPNGTANPTASCSSSDGGTWSYATTPDTYQPMTCNGLDQSAANDDILATGSLPSCFADHAMGDVFDMSGNVKEWTLARLPGQNPIRGGSSNDTAIGTSCNLNFILGTDTFFFPNVGFRCCR